MLASQEKIVMLMKESPVESDQGLPLLVVEFVTVVRLSVLSIVDFYALGLDHDKAGVDTLHLGDELFLGDGSGLGLLDQNRRSVLSWRAIGRLGRASTTARGRMACPWTPWWLIGQTSSMGGSKVCFVCRTSVCRTSALRFNIRCP
jgi:hypothetical protein